MSKLSQFIHAHAGVFKVGTEVLGLAISELPVPEAAKLPLMGILVEMNKTANNMGDNANTVASNLLSELSGGITETAPAVTNPNVQRGLELVGQLSSSAAALLSANGGQPANNVTVPNTPDAPLPSSAPAVVAAPPPVAIVAPAPAPAPVAASGSDQAAAPDAATAATLAPATAVSLGLAVDPNSAHANADGSLSAALPPDHASPAPTPQAVTANAPTDPGLAQVTGSPLDAAEAEMSAAMASGDRARITAAASALASAASSPQ